jgi:hypothetical protein
MVRQMDLREHKRRRSGSYEFGPGEEMQHDTSPHTLRMGDKKVKAQCASLVLGYSKKLFIQYYPHFTRFEAKVFLTAALKYMGGQLRTLHHRQYQRDCRPRQRQRCSHGS